VILRPLVPHPASLVPSLYNSGVPRKTGPLEYDVVICCGDGPGGALAKTVSASLAARGFRVFIEDRVADAGPDERRLGIIGSTPDFLLIPGPGDAGAGPGDRDPIWRETSHALETGRNIVVVTERGHAAPTAALPPALARALGRQAVTYDPERSAESMAVLAHRMSSETTVADERDLRRFKWLSTAAILIVLAGIATQAVPALVRILSRPRPLPPLPPLALYWSGFGQRLDNGRWVEFAPGDGDPVAAGDRLRLAFSLSADGFAYVVSKDLRGQISVLFPTDVVKGASRVRAGQVYVAPVGAGWLTVDDAADIDTIYVFASYDPLQNLEELVEEPEGSTSAGTRRQLVELTLGGLLDGRHALPPRHLWTRRGQTIDPSLRPGPGATASTVTLASGAVVSHTLREQPGLVSAVAELHFRPAGAR